MRRLPATVLAALSAATAMPALAAGTMLTATEAARRFGALSGVHDLSLSPDGTQIAYITPDGPRGTALIIAAADSTRMQPRMISRVDGERGNLRGCEWVSNTRLVCRVSGVQKGAGRNFRGYAARTLAINSDGTGLQWLVNNSAFSSDGYILTYGPDNTVLMARNFSPLEKIGSRLTSDKTGLGVVRLDTNTLRMTTIESPHPHNSEFFVDGTSTVRIIGQERLDASYRSLGSTAYKYRPTGSSAWKPFSEVQTVTSFPNDFNPYAVDPDGRSVYALRTNSGGRVAAYRVALDGSMKAEELLADPKYDVDGILTIGAKRRPIGFSIVREKREAHFFDAGYGDLQAKLSHALPGNPAIGFTGASTDEGRVTVMAGRDVEPPTFYVFDKTSKKLDLLLIDRPGLEGVALAPTDPVSFKSADGTDIPGYLTLPPKEFGKPIAGIVMPHGGPSYRDEWGFDWLVQYFAHRGYAVLQPNFRGSTGYGQEFFAENGFKSWPLAIADVSAAGRYLVSRGLATPDKLAIFGWSYGGYAALQAAATQPTLFKAVVAVAPVTDLVRLKELATYGESGRVTDKWLGDGPHLVAGSPSLQAASIQAPVLMFHGDYDINVLYEQSQRMEQRMKAAGRPVTLVTFKGLEHDLLGPDARAQLLGDSDAFLRRTLGLAN